MTRIFILSDYSSSLLPAIKQYIELRQRLATGSKQAIQSEDPIRNLSPQASPDNDGEATYNHLCYVHDHAEATPITASARGLSVSSSANAHPRAKPPASSRELLSHIAWLSEEYLRTSREKVNLAQAAHDSVSFPHSCSKVSYFQCQVDRHIRLLDQFIKEQEASLGPEPNAPVMLSMSELFVPKWSRSTRVSMSPIFGEEEEQGVQAQSAPTESSVSVERSKRRPPKSRKQKEKDKDKEKPDHGATGALTITLPPQHQEIYVDPNEPTWCYCNRVSFGEVSEYTLVCRSVFNPTSNYR